MPLRLTRLGFITLVVFGHAAVIVVSFLLASWLRFGGREEGAPWGEFIENLPIAVVGYVILALLIFNWSGLYRFDDRWTVRNELWTSFKAVLILAGATLILLYVLKLDRVSRTFLLIFFVLVWLGITLTTLAVHGFYERRRTTGKGARNVVIVGTNPDLIPLIDDLVESHPELGIAVHGYLGRGPGLVEGVPYLGPVEDLADVLQREVVDEVIVAPRQNDLDHLDAIVQIAQEQGKTVRVPLPTMGYAISHGSIERIDEVPMLTVTSDPALPLAFAAKRIVDVVLSAIALIILAPVMLVVALVVAIREGRPIIYADERAGIHGRPITIHKYRTMTTDANDLRSDFESQNDRVGPDFKIEDDPRVTPTGAVLRRTSLDELPQFWDVFAGRMSLVGPRAQRLDEVEGYDAWHRRRLSVRPGLTGLWQVTARQDPSFDTRARLDLEYIDNWSPLLDVKIMFATIPAILRSTGS